MTIILIIIAALAAAYIFAAITFYYGFKNWHPMCGGGPSSPCRPGESCRNTVSGEPVRK